MGPTIVFGIIALLVAAGVLGGTALPHVRRTRDAKRHSSRTRRDG